ncbi:MAG: peptidylprolyl isomerase [Verrucomicrobiota bacterium]
MRKSLPWRSALYGLVLLYLILDLKACQGPLYRAIQKRESETVAAARANRWLATVNQEPITREQLDVAAARHFHQRGLVEEEVTESHRRTARLALINQLIDETLIRQYADGSGYRAPEEEVAAYIESWKAQFQSAEDWQVRSGLQELSVKELEQELARNWHRKRWLEWRIAPATEVTKEEAVAWLEANRESGDGFFEPERIRARQIFLSTVETDDETREELIRRIHKELVSEEKSFAELASAHSEDLRTKQIGGDLNWFTRDRVSEDFSERVFEMEIGQISEPFRTTIGWHIVEVLDRQEQTPLLFEEIEPEIRAHLENQRTDETIRRLLRKLRKVAHIRVYREHF